MARRRRSTGLRRVLGFVPTWMEAAAGRMLKMQGLWADDFQAEFAEHEPYHVLLDSLDVRAQLHGRAPVNQALYLWAKTVLPGYILTVLGDRMEMAHSVEGRVPFLDHEVVELLRSMPVGQKIRGMTEKFVLREAARPVADGHGLSPAEAPVPEPAGDAQPQRSSARDGAGRAARLERATGPVPRSGQGRPDARRLPTLQPGEQVAIDQILMILLSACVLGERFALAALNARVLLLRPRHRDPGQAQLATRAATQRVCHHGNAVGHADDLGIAASLAAWDDDRR